MTLIWNEKNNFILSHFVSLHQEQSSTLNVDWITIANDVDIEISSTPILLKNQYESLLETFSSRRDSKSLYLTLKDMYLQVLCRKIEDHSRFTLESIYELIRHIRAERIDVDDIEQIRKAWNFKYSSDDEKQNKERLSHLLIRLRDYMSNLPIEKYRSVAEQSTESINVRQNEQLEDVSEDDQQVSNTNEHEKSVLVRRRSQSLTSLDGDNINIGAHFCVPKLTLSTSIDDDEVSNPTDISNLRQTQTQPSISWLPLTNEQILEKQRQQTELKFIDGQLLDQVSSDSESTPIQWSQSNNHPNSDTSQAASSHRTTASDDFSERKDHSHKRQKLA